MRHGKKFNHLGRKAAHRKAMLANMACSLIEHKRIKTTLAKVVLILLCSIKEQAIFASIAFLCAAFLPK